MSLVHNSVNSYMAKNWVTIALGNGVSPDVYVDLFSMTPLRVQFKEILNIFVLKNMYFKPTAGKTRDLIQN